MSHCIASRIRICVAASFVLSALIAMPAVAKGTLVYCSEGSPEGFQPQFFSTGTTFDAVSVPMFNRLVEFELGTTRLVDTLPDMDLTRPVTVGEFAGRPLREAMAEMLDHQRHHLDDLRASLHAHPEL